MSREKVCLCITSVGGTLVPATLQLLRKSSRFNYRLVGINESPAPLAQAFLDAFYVIPRVDDEKYREALLEVVRRERPDVVLPWSDEEAEIISRSTADLISYGTTPMVSSPECLARIANKRITYELLSGAGLRVPEFMAVSDVAGLVNALEKYGYPERTVVVKPSKGRGGRGLQVLLGLDNPPGWLGSGQRETRRADLALRGPLLEEFFHFGEELLVMPRLGTPAFDADVIALRHAPVIVVRRRHNPTGIPFQGNTIVSDTHLTDYCHSVTEVLKLESIHDIDLMTGTDGLPVLLEVNPRPSGSIAASLAAGFPLIDWALERVLGGNPRTYGPLKNIELLPITIPEPTYRGHEQLQR